ncbi:MAG: protease pro-enzyme activation domain-containing protein [Acidobacteriaceae bacterium]|nr:protease pro-enzyme activation domain-containing protein [Acidobacteriaceae bacterium]
MSPAYSATHNRITTAVDDASRSSIPNTIPMRARRAADLGETSSSRPLDLVTLVFSRTAEQQAELDQLLRDQQNPNSPLYHQWLTPEQFGQRFGLASGDLAKVSAWLTSKGLTIVSASPSATEISVTGSARQIEQAFRVSIHDMNENGEAHFANINDPELPAAIANVVVSMGGLNDFKPRARSIVRPLYTSSISGNHYIAPGDFYTIYDVPSSLNGSGITIAVVGQTDISTSDVSAFRAASGLSTSNLPTTVQATGYRYASPACSTGPCDVDEAQLDVEWSGAVAQNATIKFVTVGQGSTANTFNALIYAVTNQDSVGESIISVSYGACEDLWNQMSPNRTTVNQYFQQANAQGITIVSAAGDTGAADCDGIPPADYGLTVDFPASSPFVTGVGGTMFNEASLPSVTFWNSNDKPTVSNAGSVIGPPTNPQMPETVWNETAQCTAQSVAAGQGAAYCAGGGGASAYFSKPDWQTGLTPDDSSRDVPDVAFNAAAIHDPYLICSQGSCVNGFRNSSNNLNAIGGTSAGAPSMAGVLALLLQYLEQHATTNSNNGSFPGLGNVNPMLYGMASSSTANDAFHDVTSGNNASQCQPGTVNCPSGGDIGYYAATGYDQASGWGSLDVNIFITKWGSVTPAGTSGNSGSATSCAGTGTCLSTTTITPPSSVQSGTITGSTQLTITVVNASTTTGLAAPTGNVQIIAFAPNGTPISPVLGTVALGANGTVSYPFDPNSLPSGASGGYTIGAAYAGDANYAGSKGTVYLDVATGSDFALASSAASVAVASGSKAQAVTFTLTPLNGFPGTVTMTASANVSGPGSSWSFSPSSVPLSGGAQQTQLTLYGYSSAGTGTAFAMNTPPKLRTSPWTRWTLTGSGVSVACLLLFIAPRRRRLNALLALLISVAAVSASGCGGSGDGGSGACTGSNCGGGGGGGGTTYAMRGTYTVYVTATSGTHVHTSTLTFTVQ